MARVLEVHRCIKTEQGYVLGEFDEKTMTYTPPEVVARRKGWMKQ